MPRIDWNAIKQRVSNDTLLFALDRHWQQLLLATVESYQWEATYRTGGYDYADWDTLRGVVEKGTFDLMDGIMLSDIIGYIDELETLLRLIEAKTGCCPPDGTATYYPAPDMAAPSYEADGTTYPATYAGITMDDAEMYHLYICGAANQMIDNWIAGVSQLENQLIAGVATIGALAVLIAGFATFGLIVPVGLGALALAFAALNEFWDVDVFVTAADDLEASRAVLICAILDGDSAALAVAVEAIVSTAAWSAFFQWQNYANMVATVFAGEVDGDYITVTPTASECDCLYVDFDETWDFATDSEGWGMARATWSSLHGGSIALAPTVAGYAVLNITEDAMLDRLGVANGTYITPTLIEVDYYLTNIGDGTALFNNSVFGDSAYDLAQPALSTLTANADADYDRSFSSNDALQLTDASSSQVCRLELTRTGGTPAPVMYIKAIRLAGTIGV